MTWPTSKKELAELERLAFEERFNQLTIDSETVPIPPRGKPQFTVWLSPPPTPPIAWCSSTYALPGSSGPDHFGHTMEPGLVGGQCLGVLH